MREGERGEGGRETETYRENGLQEGTYKLLKNIKKNSMTSTTERDR